MLDEIRPHRERGAAPRRDALARRGFRIAGKIAGVEWLVLAGDGGGGLGGIGVVGVVGDFRVARVFRVFLQRPLLECVLGVPRDESRVAFVPVGVRPRRRLRRRNAGGVARFIFRPFRLFGVAGEPRVRARAVALRVVRARRAPRVGHEPQQTTDSAFVRVEVAPDVRRERLSGVRRVAPERAVPILDGVELGRRPRLRRGERLLGLRLGNRRARRLEGALSLAVARLERLANRRERLLGPGRGALGQEPVRLAEPRRFLEERAEATRLGAPGGRALRRSLARARLGGARGARDSVGFRSARLVEKRLRSPRRNRRHRGGRILVFGVSRRYRLLRLLPPFRSYALARLRLLRLLRAAHALKLEVEHLELGVARGGDGGGGARQRRRHVDVDVARRLFQCPHVLRGGGVPGVQPQVHALAPPHHSFQREARRGAARVRAGAALAAADGRLKRIRHLPDVRDERRVRGFLVRGQRFVRGADGGRMRDALVRERL